MIAAVSLYRMKPGHFDEMATKAINGPELVNNVKECISAIYYVDKDKEEYGSTTIWESIQDYQAFRDALPGETMKQLTEWSRDPYILNIYYDVYASANK
ncbi:MAG: antibiotic biosynthesis monooxygenase [Dehalococcoidales bacterium]|nr:antibiotic biosynthesis monooxygenase [Dehalococcoidales bacterium]